MIETPPHARRRRGRRCLLDGIHRNTSTCVEKTTVKPPDPVMSWKHLHMRGEDNPAAWLGNLDQETPPHAWRRPDLIVVYKVVYRNTSTCVEKTRCWRPVMNGLEKHLHMRGEDTHTAAMEEQPLETPPHAWRRHVVAKLDAKDNRNTSTCVEKTGWPSGRRTGHRKHLHVRGEDSPRINVA